MKMNNRFLYGILSILLAIIIAFIAIPTTSKKTNSKEEIVRISKEVPRGNVITNKDIETIEVGSYNLPDNIISDKESVIGTYAKTDLHSGDYILTSKISPIPLTSDITLNELPDGKLAFSISVKTLASGLSDKLQQGDIIRLYYFMDYVEDVPELQFVKILSVSDKNGINMDHTKPNEIEEKTHTATITILVSHEQAMLLTLHENTGILHVALVSRGNDELAKELLDMQDTILEELKLSNDDGNELDETDVELPDKNQEVLDYTTENQEEFLE